LGTPGSTAILAARTIPQYSFIDDMWKAYR
jgi:hypothetical protein